MQAVTTKVAKKQAVTTKVAKKKILQARAGVSVLPKIAKMAFGSGVVREDGTIIQPMEDQTRLNNEIGRFDITNKEIVDDTKVTYYCKLQDSQLSEQAISELALVDDDGDLLTIKNFAAKIKDSDFVFIFSIDDTM